MKKCTKCGDVKDEDGFYKDKRLLDGLRSNCKICANVDTKRGKKNNPEAVRTSLKKYYESNKKRWKEHEKSMSTEKKALKLAYGREYYSKNKEKINSKVRDWRKKQTVEQTKRYSQKYYDAHKEEICTKAKQIYSNMSHKDKVRKTEITKKWRENNPVKAKAYSAVGNAVRSGKLKKPTSCELCKSDKKRLHAHHTDYEKPLFVQWLCHICHNKQHMKERRIPSQGEIL